MPCKFTNVGTWVDDSCADETEVATCSAILNDTFENEIYLTLIGKSWKTHPEIFPEF